MNQARAIDRILRLTSILLAALLCAAPAAAAVAIPSDDPEANRELELLRNRVGGALVARVAKETGSYDFVRGANGEVLFVGSPGRSPEERAFEFLREHGALVGVRDAAAIREKVGGRRGSAELELDRVDPDDIGQTHVRLRQIFQGIPVFGGELVVHMDARGILGVNGKFLADLRLDPNPSVSAEDAAAVGIGRLAKWSRAADLRVAHLRLMVYRTGLLEGYYGSNHLAWAFEVSGADLLELVFVDAHTGAFLQSVSLRHEAKFRKVYTPEYDPNFLVRQDGTCVNPVMTPTTCPPPAETGTERLFIFAGQTYDLFQNAFNRDSYDGLGHVMESVLLINEACPNAYWNGTTTNYCPAFDVDDVVAHEWGHAYTQFTHNLIYAYQSGALNESYSDIWGETVDINNGRDGVGGSDNSVRADDGDPDPAEPPSSQRWLIGEDIPVINDPTLQIFRDMWRPDRFNNPDRVGSENYHCSADDGGGVHTNSGVPNHAYAMLVDGATFNGQAIAPIGFVKAAHIYYRAMTNYQVSTTNFAGHADALEASCSDLLGVDLKSPFTGALSGQMISATDCQQVTKAIAAVEMREDVLCDFQLILDPNTPAICPGSRPIYTEDWETGMDGWALESTGVTADWPNLNWAVRASLPSARSGSAAFAVDPIGGSCAPGGDYSGAFDLTSPVITLPAGTDNFAVRFDHYVETELTYDGGNVLLSVNGGPFALVPQDRYAFNAPPSTLGNDIPQPAGDGNTNPKAGEFAWHGTNEGTPFGSWGTTIVDLAGLASAGDTIRLRFEFGIDGCGGVTGWFVDTVQVYACPFIPGPALSIGPGYENPDTNGSYTLSWTRPSGASGPDTLQESTTSCAPLFFDDAESGFTNWQLTGTPSWQNAPAKPQHSSNVFFAKAPEAFGGDLTMTTTSAIALPAAGVTTLKWLDWNINEPDDKVFVEVSENGTSWVEVYSNARNAFAPDAAAAFATEPLVAREANLTPFNGKSVKIRFRLFHGDLEYFQETQNGWYVDDISVVNENWTDVATTSATSFTVTGRNTGSYCYRVRTRYQGGAVLSEPSNLVTVNVQLPGGQPPTSFTQNPIQDDANPDQQFGTDRDGKYKLNWTYPAPPTQQACKFRIEEANLFNTVFFDDASQMLTAGSNNRWQGTVEWVSFTHPTTNTAGYRVLYTDNLNATLTMKAAVPIFANSAALLTFDTYEDIEDGFDFGYVEISSDGGATFQALATYTGSFAGKRTIDISSYSGQNVKIRCRFTSDSIISTPLFEGWFLDNIRIESANWASIGTTANGAARTFDVTGRTGSGQSYAYRIGALYGSCTGAPTVFSNVRTIPVDIGTAAPTAGFTFSPNPGKKNQNVTFDASASIDHDTVHGSPSPGIVRYHWSFGDGGTLTTTNKIATHKFAAAGTYRVTLTVTDNDGESATTERQVPVTN